MTDPIPEKPEHDVLPPEPGGALSVPPPVPQKQPGFLRRLFMSRRKQQALAMQNGYLEMVDLIRANVRGPHYERWRHLHGCGRYFNAVRDTVSDRFLTTYKAGEPRPAPAALTGEGK